MTARTTFETAVKSASQAQIAALTTAEMTRQATIDASNSVVGYNTISGNYGAFAAAVKAANAAKIAAVTAAEQARQATITAARDTLKTSGDVGPV